MTNNTICDAIADRRVLEFTYDGLQRRVEPHCHGYSSKGKETLRGYQVGGHSKSNSVPFWRLFTVAKMGNLTVTDETFSGTRDGYNPNDKHLDPICCNL